LRASQLTFRIIHLLIAIAIVAGSLSFPYVAFWALHLTAILLLVGNAVALLWLIADGFEPFPWPVRYSTTLAHYTLAFTLVCWTTSAFFAIQYRDSKGGSIVLSEHSVGRLRSSEVSKDRGWSITLSKSSRVRHHPSGGGSRSGDNWELHYYFPFTIPSALSSLLLLTNYSATFQSIVRRIGKKA
jgi:hypothetical protein